MNNEALSRCGYRCDLCLAWKPNVNRKDERAVLSDGWFGLYGFRIAPEDIECDGCCSGDNPKLIDKGCPVRPCVIRKKIGNCAYCSEYVCDKIKQRIVNRDDLEKKLNRKLTAEEYEKFVRHYESGERFQKIRESKK